MTFIDGWMTVESVLLQIKKGGEKGSLFKLGMEASFELVCKPGLELSLPSYF